MMQRTYVEWFEIAFTTRRNAKGHYRDGVERAAALAALEAEPHDTAQIEAISCEFDRHYDVAPRWDGSIA